MLPYITGNRNRFAQQLFTPSPIATIVWPKSSPWDRTVDGVAP